MKQEDRSTLSRQRILDAAMEEFSRNGYDQASMNTLCTQNGISKGMIYHYFKDKDELYLLCVEKCFNALTEHLGAATEKLSGTAEQQARDYFDIRLRFFAENPLYMGIFASAVFSPPEPLAPQIARLRQSFNAQNIRTLTEVLQSEPLQAGLSIDAVVRDFSMYMDYFNLHFGSAPMSPRSADMLLKEHEERCHRQIHILLYGVLDRNK